MRFGLSESIKPGKGNVLPAENYFTPSGNEILILLKSASLKKQTTWRWNTLSLIVFVLWGWFERNNMQRCISASFIPIIVFNFLHKKVSVTHKGSDDYICNLQLGWTPYNLVKTLKSESRRQCDVFDTRDSLWWSVHGTVGIIQQ